MEFIIKMDKPETCEECKMYAVGDDFSYDYCCLMPTDSRLLLGDTWECRDKDCPLDKEPTIINLMEES